jgi:hypothetical protein
MNFFCTRRAAALWLCALLGCAANAQTLPSQASSAPQGDARLAPAALAEALRSGGYVIYFRHTATDFSRNDAGSRSLDDCANQRLLSPAGQAQARAIGAQIRRLRLPLGEVYASPMCRTMDTAAQALGRATPRPELRLQEDGDYPGLKQLLATPVASGNNRWLFGHGIPFRAVAGAPHLAEGEAVVMRPERTHWTVVARVLPEQWAEMK